MIWKRVKNRIIFECGFQQNCQVSPDFTLATDHGRTCQTVDGLRLGNRVKILVKRRQAAERRQLRQQQARVSTATKGRVNVMTVRVDLKRRDGFVQQDGAVCPCAFHHLPSERKIFEYIGHLALHLLGFLGRISRGVPEFEIAAHPEQDRVLVDSCGLAQFR